MDLDLVHVIADRRERGLDCVGRDLGAGAVNEHQFRAVQVESGGAGLVHLDVRFAVAQHGTVRLHHCGQREAVGSRPRRYPQRRDLDAKQVREGVVQPPADGVGIVRCVGRVGSLQRPPHLRMHRRRVVRQELHAERHGSAMRCAQEGGGWLCPIRSR